MLAIDDLTVDIQSSRILRCISLAVAAGELVCLVGRNGAGKSTTLRTIMGFLAPVSGTISFEGEALVGQAPNRIAMKGIGYAPEESEVFGDLTVAENILLPTWTRAKIGCGRCSTTPRDLAIGCSPTTTRYSMVCNTQTCGLAASSCRRIRIRHTSGSRS